MLSNRNNSNINNLFTEIILIYDYLFHYKKREEDDSNGCLVD